MTTTRRPPGRYDEPRRHPRWLAWAVGGGLGLVLAAASYATYDRAASARTPVTLEGYRVVDDGTVEVRFDVHKDRADTVVCAVRARGRDGGQVGAADVTVGPGTGKVRYALTTTARAVLGEVTGCSAP
jgi:hypothetical protein